MSGTYPGTPQHQALLEQIADFYQADHRILAVCLFGSLVRGDWDQYSDLDLDVVIDDQTQIDVMVELQNLCGAFQPLGEYPLIIVPDATDAGNIVLSSLTELSIRYHMLATTSPNIVDNLQLLVGTLDIEAIKASGFANKRQDYAISGYDVDRILRWAVEVDLRLKRQQFWQAERLLALMRQTLIEIFAVSRGYARAILAFESVADEILKARIGAAFPHYSLDSIHAALFLLLDVLESDLDAISNSQLHLTNEQHQVIARIRAR